MHGDTEQGAMHGDTERELCTVILTVVCGVAGLGRKPEEGWNVLVQSVTGGKRRDEYITS